MTSKLKFKPAQDCEPGQRRYCRVEAHGHAPLLQRDSAAQSLELRFRSLHLPLVLCTLLLPLPLFSLGRIEGKVANGTTGRPAVNQAVQLLMPAEGKVEQVAAARTNGEGRFVFAGDDVKPGKFYLLQASHEGVNYHEPVRFGQDGNATANFKVYEVSPTLPGLEISSARIVVRAQGDKVRVEELFALRNDTNPPVAYLDPHGTFKFKLDQQVGQPSVAVIGEMNLPLQQTAELGNSPGQYFIRYPLKPGLTVVMVAYESDYSSESFSLAGSVPYPIGQIEMDVVPASLGVSSSLFKPAGQDEDSGGEKLLAENVRPDEALEATFHGAPLAANGSSSNQGSGDVQELPNAMTRLGWPLIGCFLLVLLWAMGVRVSKEWTRRDIARPGSPALKELQAKLEKLLDSLANLDELFEGGKLPEKKYWRERLDLKAKVVVLLRKTPPAFLQSYASRHTPR